MLNLNKIYNIECLKGMKLIISEYDTSTKEWYVYTNMSLEEQ